MRAIRRRLGLGKNQFAKELGYTGTSRNNVTQIKRYEGDRRLIPLYIARLAWLLDQLLASQSMLIANRVQTEGFPLPAWPQWPGYTFDHDPDPIKEREDKEAN